MSNIIVTVGPKSCDVKILKLLKQAGASRFRINLSHSNSDSLARYFDTICDAGLMPCIDTQGAQLRVEEMHNTASLKSKDQTTIIFGEDQTCDLPFGSYLRVNHPEASDQVLPGDLLKIDFSGFAIRLIEQSSEFAWKGEVVGEGPIVINRAVDVQSRQIRLSALTNFDISAIEYAKNRGCSEFYGSFVSSSEDIRLIRSYIGNDSKLISKIESSKGVANAAEIASQSDEILIDRGDLSREISIPAIPIAVLGIIKLCKRLGTPVNIATNVLDSMMTSKLPSRAEISDIFTHLQLGVDGFVLAAEVAIGQNPVSSTALIDYMIRVFDSYQNELYGVGKTEKPPVELIGKELHNWL